MTTAPGVPTPRFRACGLLVGKQKSKDHMRGSCPGSWHGLSLLLRHCSGIALVLLWCCSGVAPLYIPCISLVHPLDSPWVSLRLLAVPLGLLSRRPGLPSI